MIFRWMALVCVLIAAGTASAQDCTFRTGRHIEALNDIGAIQSIELKTRKYRKWVRNGLAILTSRTKNIPAHLKTGFKARVTIRYPFGECAYEARIRQNGDWKDHIRFSGAHIARSLDVRMKTGNVAGVVRFKLFLPETRLSLNEIFATELLRELDFITPRTRVMPVNHDGRRALMIFQEKPAKELLERHKRREGPLLEGEEGLIWAWRLHSPNSTSVVEALSLARLINHRWAARGGASAAMSAGALAKMQATYAAVAFAPDRWLGLPLFRYENRRPGAFEAILLGLNARHGVIPHNRQFYWNALADEFEPIYYDGNALLSPVDLDHETPKDLAFLADLFTPALIDGLRRRIAAIDRRQLAGRISRLGLTSVETASVAETLVQVDRNLDALSALRNSSHGPLETEPDYDVGAEILRRAPGVYRDARVSTFTGFNGGAAVIETCEAHACDSFMESLTALSQRMAGEGLRGGGPKDFFVGAALNTPVETTDIPALGLTVRHAPGGQVAWDDARRELTFTQGKPGDWFLAGQTDIRDLTIRFAPAAGQAAPPDQRFNAFGVTGCLTLFNARFSNASITGRGGGCEDVINIVGGSGVLTSIRVEDAPFDAVDLDFADIAIDRLEIRNAGNDCLDVSSGAYRIAMVAADACGDKGVSVGEGSHVRIDRFDVRGAAIGVSSKDSSAVEIGEADMALTPTCHEAFRKKQEFGGARLHIGKLSCDGAATVDAGSVAEVGARRM